MNTFPVNHSAGPLGGRRLWLYLHKCLLRVHWPVTASNLSACSDAVPGSAL